MKIKAMKDAGKLVDAQMQGFNEIVKKSKKETNTNLKEQYLGSFGDLEHGNKQTLHEQVKEFHHEFDSPVRTKPCIPSRDEVKLRLALVGEEFQELLEACGFEHARVLMQEVRDSIKNEVEKNSGVVDLIEVADAIADLFYVLEGSNLVFGINGELISEEVHRSNMSKKGATKRADGKILKPATYFPPNIEKCLLEQGWEK